MIINESQINFKDINKIMSGSLSDKKPITNDISYIDLKNDSFTDRPDGLLESKIRRYFYNDHPEYSIFEIEVELAKGEWGASLGQPDEWKGYTTYKFVLGKKDVSKNEFANKIGSEKFKKLFNAVKKDRNVHSKIKDSDYRGIEARGIKYGPEEKVTNDVIRQKVLNFTNSEGKFQQYTYAYYLKGNKHVVAIARHKTRRGSNPYIDVQFFIRDGNYLRRESNYKDKYGKKVIDGENRKKIIDAVYKDAHFSGIKSDNNYKTENRSWDAKKGKILLAKDGKHYKLTNMDLIPEDKVNKFIADINGYIVRNMNKYTNNGNLKEEVRDYFEY